MPHLPHRAVCMGVFRCVCTHTYICTHPHTHFLGAGKCGDHVSRFSLSLLVSLSLSHAHTHTHTPTPHLRLWIRWYHSERALSVHMESGYLKIGFRKE